MTTLYLVRHCQADNSISDDRERPLTDQGEKDSLSLTAFLDDRNISHIYSSPYKRAVDTVRDFALKNKLMICTEEAFREHKSARDRSLSYDPQAFYLQYWQNVEFKLPEGDSFLEVQQRCIAALQDLLHKHEDENFVVVSHGFACGTILNYYDSEFAFEKWWLFNYCTPAMVELHFKGQKYLSSRHYQLKEF